MIYLIHRGFIKVLNRRATEFDTRAKNWQGPLGHGVFVEEVEITAPKGPPVVFPCRCWLAEDEDDGPLGLAP